MSFFYSPEEETALEEAMPTITTELRTAELALPPTGADRQKLQAIFLNFAKSHQRVIYGGFAFHLLIKHASKGADGVYTDADRPDIEFYTPNLKSDVRELCHLIHSTGYRNILAEEGIHPTTFKLRVEFTDVGDVTFLPMPFFNIVPFVDIDGLRVMNAEFAMMDVFRVYSFPITRFFRLEKSYTRANLLLKYYPLEWDEAPLSGTPNAAAAFKKMVDNKVFTDNVILTGQAVQNMMCREVGLEEDPMCLPIVALSTAYDTDVERLSKTFRGHPKSFLPFSDYIERKTLFFDNGTPVLMLIELAEECVSYNTSIGIRCTTNQATAFFAMTLLYQALTQKRAKDAQFQRRILQRLLEAKRVYRKKHPQDMIKTQSELFREMVVSCAGEATPPFRKFGLDKKRRIEAKTVIKYYYNPEQPDTSRQNQAFMSLNTFQTVGQEENKLDTEKTDNPRKGKRSSLRHGRR